MKPNLDSINFTAFGHSLSVRDGFGLRITPLLAGLFVCVLGLLVTSPSHAKSALSYDYYRVSMFTSDHASSDDVDGLTALVSIDVGSGFNLQALYGLGEDDNDDNFDHYDVQLGYHYPLSGFDLLLGVGYYDYSFGFSSLDQALEQTGGFVELGLRASLGENFQYRIVNRRLLGDVDQLGYDFSLAYLFPDSPYSLEAGWSQVGLYDRLTVGFRFDF